MVKLTVSCCGTSSMHKLPEILHDVIIMLVGCCYMSGISYDVVYIKHSSR